MNRSQAVLLGPIAGFVTGGVGTVPNSYLGPQRFEPGTIPVGGD